MAAVSPFWKKVDEKKIKLGADSRARAKTKKPSYEAIGDRDCAELQKIVKDLKLKVKLLPPGSPGAGSGKYTSIEIPDSGQSIVVVLRTAGSQGAGGSRISAKEFTPDAMGLKGKKVTSVPQMVKAIESNIEARKKIDPHVRAVILHLTKVTIKKEKFDGGLVNKLKPNELATLINDFGEILAALDSLVQKKKYIVFSPESNTPIMDYMEEDVPMAVKSGKSEKSFGSGNTITNLTSEIDRYKPKGSSESMLLEGFRLLTHRKVYDTFNYFGKHLPYMKKLVKAFKDMGYPNMDELNVRKFVDDHSKMNNEQMYNILPETEYGKAKNILKMPVDWNSFMFFVLTNLSFDINENYSKDVNNMAQKFFAMKGSVKLILLTNAGLIFKAQTYNEFFIKFHYWANAGKALNNWPGFKVTKK